jgi:mannose-6-phosphate isomerase-like protein (cupin superfamily)
MTFPRTQVGSFPQTKLKTRKKKMLIRKFADGEKYTQEAGPNCEFMTVLKRGEAGDMGAGLIKMQGPTWNKPASHDKWHQFYILLKGTGIMLIGEKKFPVSAPSVITIPLNTTHAMEVAANESVEYIYVNQYLQSPEQERHENQH